LCKLFYYIVSTSRVRIKCNDPYIWKTPNIAAPSCNGALVVVPYKHARALPTFLCIRSLGISKGGLRYCGLFGRVV